MKARRVVVLFVLSMMFFSCGEVKESRADAPIVYLNHVYVCLDSTTYASIVESEFLKDRFAYVETRTTYADNGASWTGTYIWGENTYLEFFDIGDVENKGWSGIGYCVEMENGIDSLHNRLSDEGVTNLARGLRTRKVEKREIPWFYWFGFSNEDSTATILLNTWLMEYHREYIEYKYQDIDPDSISITRRLYNKKYYRDDLLLDDVIEIELAVDEFDFKNLLGELRNYGYRMELKGESVTAVGPEIKIIVRPRSEDNSGLCRIRFALTDKRYEPQTVQFGSKSRLILHEDRTAEWFFSI